MAKSLQLLIATALALLMAAPASAAGASSLVTLTGTLTSVHEDKLGSFAESDHYYLASGADRYELQFPAGGGPDGGTGSQVTVTGQLSGHVLHVAGSGGSSFRILRQGPVSALTTGTTTTTTSGATAKTALVSGGGAQPTASVAAVMFNLTDLNSQPFTAAQTASALYGSSTSAKAYYEEESKGRMTMTGAVFGWYTINDTVAGCDWSTWVTLATNAANAAGANLSAYTNVVYVFPYTTQCQFAGLGYVPGAVSLLNGTLSVQVMTHELGHNFGLAHANAINCVVNGVRVALSSAANCTEVSYADPFSTMGNNALRHNQGSQLGELGWLADSEKVIGGPGNTYSISPYFGSGPVKLVRIPRGDGSYFDLDLRMTYGAFDNFAAGSPAVSGVTIRLGWGTASPTNNPHATQLIDTTPATSTLDDAPLLLGRTFTDPVSSVSFTTVSLSGGAVQVRVTEPVPPSAPSSLTATPAADFSSISLAWGPATDNVAVLRYQVARNGTLVATVDAGTTSWTDTGIARGVGYTYTVSAVDTSGNVGPAATAAASTPADPNAVAGPAQGDAQPPTAPAPLSGAPATTWINLNWGASTDDTGVAGYRVTRNGVLVAQVGGTSWTNTGLAPRTSYTFTVSAYDAAGNVSAASSVVLTTTADTIAPSVPRSFHRVRQYGRYVTFGWYPSSDNVRVARYLIYRVGSSRPVASTTRTSIRFYTTRGRYYYVRALDTSGNLSGRSNLVYVRY